MQDHAVQPTNALRDSAAQGRKRWTALIDDIVAGAWINPDTGRTVATPYRSIVIEDSLEGREAELVRGLGLDAKLAVVTRSEKGCIVVNKASVEAVPAAPIDKLVDATGAGDLFAAGFLFGLARGRDHKTAARLGGLAAAEVIQHIGARPEVSLKSLAQQNGLPV